MGCNNDVNTTKEPWVTINDKNMNNNPSVKLHSEARIITLIPTGSTRRDDGTTARRPIDFTARLSIGPKEG